MHIKNDRPDLQILTSVSLFVDRFNDEPVANDEVPRPLCTNCLLLTVVIHRVKNLFSDQTYQIS